ncbi:amidohydrolase [Bacillus sp. AFS031507]|uniref:amidohydrolase n=1 Tax=Bacillus sp. AFS031507 TaxID=2033496 RepID=UPI000BFD8538|nr:amidohydrolase [Bacillus sp. AFS031507]PGY06338.1 amidohydrolase [Bacillus sp. AFS031507]
MSQSSNELTFINGKIFTSNPEQPYASAMVVRNGRIAWIGEEEDLKNIEGKCVDLYGKSVLPGLIDAHLHPLYLAGAAKQIACTQPLIHSISDLQEQIRLVRASQSQDSWIQGWGYDEGKLLEGRAPTRRDLDLAAPDVPVVITRTCAHIISVNSKALELAGITKDTPDPQGGKIDRDENGEPTGILRENAKNLVNHVMPETTLEDDAALLAELSPVLLSHGITAITELMGRTKPNDYIEMYQLATEKGLKQRSVLYYIWEDLKEQPVIEQQKLVRKNQIHIGGIKLFSDGSVSGQTAWVNPPFLGEGENYGIQMTTREELLAATEAAKKHKIQLVIHAMGEQAIDLIVDTFYGQKGWLTDAPSIRIEHAAMPTPGTLKRAAETGIAFVSQPIFLFAEIETYLRNLGAERTKQTYPFKAMLEAGIKLAFSSDAPATAWADPVNPFVGIKSAVTRLAHDGTDTGKIQRVDVETAITLYTRAAQEIIRIPNVGQLKPGFHADFIVLDKDLLIIDPEQIDEIKVVETYMAGNLVYKLDSIEKLVVES